MLAHSLPLHQLNHFLEFPHVTLEQEESVGELLFDTIASHTHAHLTLTTGLHAALTTVSGPSHTSAGTAAEPCYQRRAIEADW